MCPEVGAAGPFEDTEELEYNFKEVICEALAPWVTFPPVVPVWPSFGYLCCVLHVVGIGSP